MIPVLGTNQLSIICPRQDVSAVQDGLYPVVFYLYLERPRQYDKPQEWLASRS